MYDKEKFVRNIENKQKNDRSSFLPVINFNVNGSSFYQKTEIGRIDKNT